MKITKLQLVNIRSHVKTLIEPMEKLVIIRGDLNVGKSSIEMGIQVSLTGTAETTDENGAGMGNLIRTGEESGSISLAIDNAGEPIEMRCKISVDKKGAASRDLTIRNPNVPGFDTTQVLKFFANNKDALRCLCNNRYFTRQDPKAQKRILASIVLPSTYDFPEACMASCAHLDLQVPWSEHPFVVIEKAYDLAFKARTAINRDIKAWIMPEAPDKAALTVEDAKKNIDSAREQVAALESNRYHARSEYDAGHTLRLSRMQLVDSLRTRLSSERQELDRINKSILSDDAMKKLKKTANESERAEILDDTIRRQNEEMERITALGAHIDSLNEGAVCPTCMQQIAGEFLQQMAEQLAKQNNEAITKHRAAVASRKEIGDFEAAKLKIANHSAAEKDLKIVQKKVIELEKELAGAEGNIPTEATQPDTTSIDAEIERAKELLDRAQNDLIAASKAATLISERRKATERREALDADLAMVEKLVKYFGSGPEGVKSELLAQNVEPFTDKLNTVLMAWNYSCTLSLEPYGFFVTKYYMEEVERVMDLNQMSESEKYRFSIAFQIALAIATGIGFCVIDGSEILTPSAKGALMEKILGNEELDQVIVIGTDTRIEIPGNIPGVSFFYLNDNGKGATVMQLTEEEEVCK